MRNLKQLIFFTFELFLFVFSGFFIAVGISLGYVALILGSIMAVVTGKQIEKDAIQKYKELENGCK